MLRRHSLPIPTWAPIFLWVVFSLSLAGFHEPWRDEAQAWLVATSSNSLPDLLLRSSMEATGPLYYLLLWPFAKASPGAFPSLIFWISWLGTFLLIVYLWTRIEFVPSCAKWLISFGFLLGYEYPLMARLYGWGGFLLLWGVDSDTRGRKVTATIALSLSAATQLTFLFAVAGWMLFRILSTKRLDPHYWIVSGCILLSLAHLHLASHLRPWPKVPLAHLTPVRVGTTLGMPFAQTPGLWGWSGFALFLLGIWHLGWHGRFALFLTLSAFAYLFLFAYAGVARGRHGGAAFLLWVCLYSLSGGLKEKSGRRCFALLLILSVVSMVIAHVNDIRKSYSYGQQAAEIIRRHTTPDKPLRIVTSDLSNGFVPAAILGVSVVSDSRWAGCPYFPGPCGSWLSFDERRDRPVYPGCGSDADWFYLTMANASAPAVPNGTWQLLFKPADPAITDENTHVYQLVCSPGPPKL